MATWSGLSSDAALRSKVASSNAHCGDASRQIELREVAPVSCRSPRGRVRWRSSTDTTTGSSAAGGSGAWPGCLTADRGSRSPRRGRRQRSGHSAAMMPAVRAPQSTAGDDHALRSRAHPSERDRRRPRAPTAARCGAVPVGAEARRAVAPQVRDDHAVSGFGASQGDDLGEAADVVRPAVQEHARPYRRSGPLRA